MNNTDNFGIAIIKIIDFVKGFVIGIIGLIFISIYYNYYVNKKNSNNTNNPLNTPSTSGQKELEPFFTLSCSVCGIIMLFISGYYFYISISDSEFSNDVREIQLSREIPILSTHTKYIKL